MSDFLGKLIVCYDDNHITIDGDTNLAFTEDVNMRYESYGWHVQTVEDVNDIASVRAAIQAAKEEIAKPSLIKVFFHLISFPYSFPFLTQFPALCALIRFAQQSDSAGQYMHFLFGDVDVLKRCPNRSRREGTHHVHGAPLGAVDIQQLKEKFQFNPEEVTLTTRVVLVLAPVSPLLLRTRLHYNGNFNQFSIAEFCGTSRGGGHLQDQGRGRFSGCGRLERAL